MHPWMLKVLHDAGGERNDSVTETAAQTRTSGWKPAVTDSSKSVCAFLRHKVTRSGSTKRDVCDRHAANARRVQTPVQTSSGSPAERTPPGDPTLNPDRCVGFRALWVWPNDRGSHVGRDRPPTIERRSRRCCVEDRS